MVENKGKSFDFIKKLNIMLCAKMSVWVTTTEEEKFLRLFRKIAKAHKVDDERFGIFTWSITEGLLDATPNMVAENNVYRKPIPVAEIKQTAKLLEEKFGTKVAAAEPIPVISFADTYEYIMKNCKKKMFIIKDIHNLLDKSRADYPAIVRRLKDLIYYTRTNDSDIIFLCPVTRIPIDLETDIQVLEMPRPDEIDIEELLNKAFSEMHHEEPTLHFDIDFLNQKGKLVKSLHPKSHSLKEKVVMNLRGLTESEIAQIVKFICVKNHGIDEAAINEIKDAKKQIIEKNGVLSIISVPHEIEVGGHDEFKKYIDSRGLYLNKDLRFKFKLPAPKGVLLVGVPGAGKSLNARYIGYKWNIPLIRFNMDAVFNKYLGESEDNLRTALSIAEANAPCILWLEEIEKALGGMNTSGDSGTGMRILGKILTWMQEREEMVFLFATANNVSKLPPELLRAGRFDDKFWADLPTLSECRTIFEIKTRESGFMLSEMEYTNLAMLAHKKGMTGAEIEHSVFQGLYSAAVDNPNGSIELKHLQESIKNINSHAMTHKTTLDKERKLALQNYIFTSNESKKAVESQNST